mmetsp:Transcript_14535/g.40016  ORF Transcript_14535/g.40016 Transcript_14535/m.40016 type:complete len:204 (+) Transcript_14535:955-1566(+)
MAREGRLGAFAVPAVRAAVQRRRAREPLAAPAPADVARRSADVEGESPRVLLGLVLVASPATALPLARNACATPVQDRARVRTGAARGRLERGARPHAGTGLASCQGLRATRHEQGREDPASGLQRPPGAHRGRRHGRLGLPAEAPPQALPGPRPRRQRRRQRGGVESGVRGPGRGRRRDRGEHRAHPAARKRPVGSPPRHRH